MNNYSISTNSILYNFGNASTDQPECKSFIAPSSVSSQVVMTTAYCVLLLSLVGNSLVVIVFLKPSGRPRTPVDYFIVNMSVSDLFVPLFTILRRLQEIYLGWSPWLMGGLIRDLLCRFINFVEEVSIAVSMLSMVFISLERFWSVVYPLKLPLITKKTSPRFVAFSWIFAVLTFSYYFVAYKLVVKNDQLYCQYVLPASVWHMAGPVESGQDKDVRHICSRSVCSSHDTLHSNRGVPSPTGKACFQLALEPATKEDEAEQTDNPHVGDRSVAVLHLMDATLHVLFCAVLFLAARTTLVL